MANAKEVVSAYSEFIQSFPWDFYSTVTFREPRRDPIRAAQAVSKSLSVLGASRAFIACEQHRAANLHVHCLSRHTFNPSLSPSSIWLYLWKAYGRSTVETIRETSQVSSYCAKYVTKGSSFDFIGSPESWLLDK